MTHPTNEAVEKMRERLRWRAADPCDEGCHEDDQYIVGDLLDAALAAERRAVVEQVREHVETLEREARRMTATVDGPSANHHTGREYAFREIQRLLDQVSR